MVYSLNLSVEEMKRIGTAESLGIQVETLLRGAIASLSRSLPQMSRTEEQESAEHHLSMPLPHITRPLSIRFPSAEESKAADAYFAERVQQALTDPAEIEEAETEFEALMQNMKAWR